MKSFKHFLRHRKKPKGSWQVEGPADDLDIKQRLRNEISIGFGTIHKDDVSDKLLRLSTHQRMRKMQEDASSPEDHRLVHEYKSSETERHAPATPYLVSKADDGRRRHLKVLDSEEFAHHHELNRLHAEGKPNGNAISSYTYRSRSLNHHLIAKYQGPEREREHLESLSHEYGSNLDHTKERLDHHAENLSKETNHPANVLKKPTVVHSGPGERMQEILKNTKVGDHIHFPAFTSTTTHSSTAHLSSALPNARDEGNDMHEEHHVMHFHLPQGYTRGRHVSNISTHPHEHEMILDKGQTFKKAHEWTEHTRTREPTTTLLGAWKGEVHHVTHHHFVPDEQ